MGVQDDWYVKRLNENIRRSTIAGLKARGRVLDLNDKIRNRQRSEELKELSSTMKKSLASILKDLVSDLLRSHVDTTRWLRLTGEITIEGAGAMVALTTLRDEIAREADRWRTCTDENINVPETSVFPSLRPPQIVCRPTRAATIARILADVKQEEQRKDHELTRSLVESLLKGLVASIDLLISYRRRYEQVLLR